MHNKAFSIIELMIILIIIGVLTAYAIPSYKNYVIRSKLAEITAVFPSIQQAVSAFYEANGRMPSTLADINVTSSSYNTKNISSIGLTTYPCGILITINVNSTNVGTSGNLFYGLKVARGMLQTLCGNSGFAATGVPTQYAGNCNSSGVTAFLNAPC